MQAKMSEIAEDIAELVRLTVGLVPQRQPYVYVKDIAKQPANEGDDGSN